MDEKALFEKRFKENKSLVFSAVGKYIYDRELRQDLVQQTFLTAWVKRDLFNGKSKYSTWIYRVAVNCTINYIKTHQHKIFILNRVKGDFDSLPLANNYIYSSPIDFLCDQEDLNQVAEAAKTLPKDLYKVLVLYVVYGLPYLDISKALRIPEGTVKSRLNRAKKMLSEKIAQKDTNPSKC